MLGDILSVFCIIGLCAVATIFTCEFCLIGLALGVEAYEDLKRRFRK